MTYDATTTHQVGAVIMIGTAIAGLFPAALALRLWLGERRATRGKVYE